MNISFTDKQEKYIRDKVASGDYQNASEVVREAIRMFETHQMKLNNLKGEIQKGIDSGYSHKSVLDILNEAKQKYGKQ